MGGRSRVLPRILCFVVAVAPAARAQVAAAGPPTLEGIAVWDGPIQEAGDRVQRVWRLTQAALASRPPTPAVQAGLSEQTRWVREALTPWIRSRAVELHVLDADLRALARGDARSQTFGAIVAGTLYEHVVAPVRALVPPAGLATDPALAAAFRDAVADQIAPHAAFARQGWLRCSAVVNSAPPAMRAWAAECARRALALEPLVRASRPLPPLRSAPGTPPPPLPSECAGAAGWRDPDAPPPDERSPREVAVLWAGKRPSNTETVRRIVEAVHARLRARGLARVVPIGELDAAQRLHAERRLQEGGPACGQAPPVPSILARRHPNLVLAQVASLCPQVLRIDFEGSSGVGRSGPGMGPCRLTVAFKRAGSDDRRDLPPYVEAEVRGESEDAWMEAARRLGSPITGLLGMLGPLRGGPVAFAVAGHEDDDAQLRVAPTLNALRREIEACHPGGAASYGLRWTISATGAASDVQVVPRTPPTGDAAAAARCIAGLLDRSAWPCTPSGAPVGVEAVVCVAR